jgi:hypothetical protein
LIRKQANSNYREKYYYLVRKEWKEKNVRTVPKDRRGTTVNALTVRMAADSEAAEDNSQRKIVDLKPRRGNI